MPKLLLEAFNEDQLRPGLLPPDCHRLVKSMAGPDLWKLSGYDMGDLTIVSENDNYIAVKEAGHSYWWANHEPYKYAPAEYQVYEKIEYDDGFVVRQIMPAWLVKKPRA